MKIFDKVKNNNITPLMCASMCQTQSCFAYENTKNYGLATFLMIVPIVLFSLMKLIANRKKTEVSFKKFFCFLLLSFPVYLLIYHVFFFIFNTDGLDIISQVYPFLVLALFVFVLFEKLSWRDFFLTGGFLLLNSSLAQSLGFLAMGIAVLLLLVLFILFLLKKVPWAYIFIPFLILCGHLGGIIASYITC